MWIAEFQCLNAQQKKQLSSKATLQKDFPALHFKNENNCEGEKLFTSDQKQLNALLSALKLKPSNCLIQPASGQVVLGSKLWKQKTTIEMGDLKIGTDDFVIMAGPCALEASTIESEEELMLIARRLKKSGARVLRAGCYKPRTSPYSFQGVEARGFDLLSKVCRSSGLLSVSEVVDEASLEMSLGRIDILQVGSRNMFNYSLLKKIARSKSCVLLKRGFQATYEEWLLSAEYLLAHGCSNIILCERGIRTFEQMTRFTLDLQAVAVMKELTHLPIIIDPSHSTGNRRWVDSMAMAALAAGADGLMLEVHPNPHAAACDGAQSLSIEGFDKLSMRLKSLAKELKRHF